MKGFPVKKSKLIRIHLDSDPYQITLCCPYCGEVILEPDGENVGECEHTLLSGMEDDPEDSEITFRANDLCFVMHELAPADRDHYVVFRENP